MWDLLEGDCVEVMRSLEAGSVDAIVCDPPYGLRFMGKEFDKLGDGPAQQEWHRVWLVEAERVLRPGGRLLAFGGTRTYHRLALAVRDAGFAPDGVFAWVYGSGFPKSHNIANSIDKLNGHENRGRAIPAASTHFPTGRYATEKLESNKVAPYEARSTEGEPWQGWGTALKPAWEPVVSAIKPGGKVTEYHGPRFRYCPKANKRERNAGLEDRNSHPTVKPIEVMAWLIRCASDNGTILDPFVGSGTTGIAAIQEGRPFVGIEREAEYLPIARARLEHWDSEPKQLGFC